MFKAKRKDGSPVWIENAIIGEEYFCPTCGEPLIIKAKNSKAVKPYFSHSKGTLCSDNWKYDILQENFLQQYGINTGWSSIQQLINESYPQQNAQKYNIVRRPVHRNIPPNPIEIKAMIKRFSSGGVRRYSANNSKKNKRFNYHGKPKRF